RLQLPTPHQVVERFFTLHSGGPLRPVKIAARLKIAFFTEDYIKQLIEKNKARPPLLRQPS
ncbi:MAG: hypothetical protein WA268_27355, partial [Xanthobacteraceae bacterium]